MRPRAVSLLAWSLGLVSVALLSASAVLLVLNRPTRVVEGASVWGTANVPFICSELVRHGEGRICGRRPAHSLASNLTKLVSNS